MADNQLATNRWGSPIIRPGQELLARPLQDFSPTQLAQLDRMGGQIIGRNSQGLNVRAQIEAMRAAQAAAQQAARQAAAQPDPFARALGEDYRHAWPGATEAGQSPVANALARARQDSISPLPDDPITRFFNGHPVGRVWRGASEAALGWIPSMVGSAGDALADVWDYARGTRQPESVLAPESAAYRMRTPLMQTFADYGLPPALGQLVTGTVQGMPGISLIDALGQPSRDWDAVGAAALGAVGGRRGTPHTASSRFTNVQPLTAAERNFIANAQATFASSPTWTDITRHRGELVIQRSDIELTPQNLRLMAAGRAPFVRNYYGQWQRVELHHVGRNTGRMIEVLQYQNRYSPRDGGFLHIPGSGQPVRQDHYTSTYWQACYNEIMRSRR